ncbi:MAG: DUF460 domain-containing protein [Candidatus Hodarchaeales archaeon]|jgi:predicted RNase H-like nuclease (RuvC/YqgF family)
MISSTIIFGLDILARSNKKSEGFIFSLVVLTENHIDKYPKLNRKALFKKIYDLKPNYIAIDNIFELSPNAKGIIRFLQKIPPDIVLVQVTGSPRTGMEKINTLTRKFRLKDHLSFPLSSNKLNSVETAEVCARLCQKRVGHEILAFEEEIRIRVSKKKKHGRGGWSAPRYERISRAAVTHAADEVEQILRGKGITWEMFEYPKRRIYLALLGKELITEIKGLLKNLTTDLVQVTLERITRSSLGFQPLDVSIAPTRRSLRNIILGIDPGTTTGIAIIDLMKGDVIYLGSKRECGISEILRITSKYGKVCCVAADVTPVPATVEKIAKITGAKLKSPAVLASAAKKREYLHEYRDLTVNYGHINSHERDALFGALKAYNSLKEQQIKVHDIIHESHPELISKISEIQRLVLSGNSIVNAVTMIQEQLAVQEGSVVEKDQESLINSFKHEISMLQAKIDIFYEEMDKLDKEVIFWRKKSKDVIVEIKKQKDNFEQERLRSSSQDQKNISIAVKREVGRIIEENLEIRRLLRQHQEEMQKLKQIKNFWIQGREIPLKIVKSFSESSIRETVRDFGINKGDIVLVLDPSGGGAQTAQKMINLGIKGVIVPENTANFSDQALIQLEENCVPFLQLPVKDFSKRTEDNLTSNLAIWTYDELFLIDIAIKEEIRKLEIKLQEKLRKKRISLRLQKKFSLDTQIKSDMDIERLLDDFRANYIAQYGLQNNEKIESSLEEEE